MQIQIRIMKSIKKSKLCSFLVPVLSFYCNEARIVRPKSPLKMRDTQQRVANADDYEKSNDAGRDSSSEEMLNTQVAMTTLGVFEHDCRCSI